MIVPPKSYYAIITAKVRYDSRLTANAKLLYGEITALCNEMGYCWATNTYFATLYGVSKASISSWIGALESCGFVQVILNYKPGSKEIESRHIYLKDAIVLTTPMKENLHTPMKEILQDNNTKENNKEIISKDIIEPQSEPLIPIKSKKDKKGDDIVTMKGMTEVFTSNEEVKKHLESYFKFRLSVGLNSTQWKLILEDLRSYAGEDADLAIEKIKHALAGGYRQIIASWEKNKNPRKPVFDNTVNASVQKAAVHLTEDEFKEFEEDLARDENGNLIGF